MIFPEGTPGIGKPFSDRYQLQEWRVGHCELAIRYRAPVVPVGIVGAEEQMPQLARIPMPKASPVPYLPVPATPLPLPVRYHIHFGEPMHFQGSPHDEDRVIAAKVEEDRQAELDAIAGKQAQVGWGSQIRSYVLQPYRMVKDHRTGIEVGDAQKVLDGGIDDFIEGWLAGSMGDAAKSD